MIEEAQRNALLRAVRRYVAADRSLYEVWSTADRLEAGRSADWLCAVVIAFLEDDNASFRGRFTDACWLGKEHPTDESVERDLESRAEEIRAIMESGGIPSEELENLLAPRRGDWPGQDLISPDFTEWAESMKKKMTAEDESASGVRMSRDAFAGERKSDEDSINDHENQKNEKL